MYLYLMRNLRINFSFISKINLIQFKTFELNFNPSGNLFKKYTTILCFNNNSILFCSLKSSTTILSKIRKVYFTKECWKTYLHLFFFSFWKPAPNQKLISCVTIERNLKEEETFKNKIIIDEFALFILYKYSETRL